MTVSNGAVAVGRRIALLRYRLGLSQVAFARQAGISRNALITYERGGGVPKSEALARIAKAGESSVDWLLNGRVPRARPREDPEWEAALRKLRATWRDRTRRRLAIVMLTDRASSSRRADCREHDPPTHTSNRYAGRRERGRWELLEQRVRARRWTTGARADETCLRALAAKFGMVLHVEEIGVISRRSEAPTTGLA